MRLLTRQPHLGLWILAEFLPMLLRHYLGSCSRDAVFDEEEDEEEVLPRKRHTQRIIR